MIKHNLICRPDITIREALEKFNKSGQKCIYIEKNNKLVGSLTDGDIRKFIIKDINLNTKITKFFNKRPKYLEKSNYSLASAKQILLKYKINSIAITSKKKIIDIKTWTDIFKSKKILKKHTVFIMAGGRGERLMPFTSILPKPLIPINGTPIIKLIIDSFDMNKTKNIFVSVNYKYSIIKSYLNSETKNRNLLFIKEQKPLGTIGSLKLADEKKLTSNIIVSFCDIIFQNNMDNVIETHERLQNDLTIVVSKKKIKLPYGVCRLSNKGKFLKIDEKPESNLFINVGYYIINKKLLKYIKKNKKLDMTDFIAKVKTGKNKIGIYPIDDKNWFDVGEWPKYKNTLTNFNSE